MWDRAREQDLTAPGLLGYVLSPGWTIAIVAGAAIALINDLPAMLLSVSRLVFAWAEDGIFPKKAAAVHPRRRTPHVAIIASGVMASVGITGSHLAGDFFLGIDILVISMLVNFGLMCLALLTLPRRNPDLAARVTVLTGRAARTLVGGAGVVVLGTFLFVQVLRDLTTEVAAWYFHPTWVWLLVMAIASGVYLWKMTALRTSGADVARIFRELPPE